MKTFLCRIGLHQKERYRYYVVKIKRPGRKTYHIVVNLIFFLTTIIKPVYVLLIILFAALIGLLALTL